MPKIFSSEMRRLQPNTKLSSESSFVILPHTRIHKDTLRAILSINTVNSPMKNSLCTLLVSNSHYISAETLFCTLPKTSNPDGRLFHSSKCISRCERLFTHGHSDAEERKSASGPQTNSEDKMMLMIRQAYIKQQISESNSKCPEQCTIL